MNLTDKVQYCVAINNIMFWHGAFCIWKAVRNILCLDPRCTYFAAGVAGVFLNLFFFFKGEILSLEEMSTRLFKFPEIRGRTLCQTMPLHFKTSPHKLC